MSKYGVFSSPELLRENTDRKNSVFGHFSRSVSLRRTFNGAVFCTSFTLSIFLLIFGKRQANEVKKFPCFKSSYSFVIIIHHIFMTCNVRLFSIWRANTAWKMPKYRVFSGPYFPVPGLNTEIYGVNLRFQSEYRKIRTRKNSALGHFSRTGTDPEIWKKEWWRRFGIQVKSLNIKLLK